MATHSSILAWRIPGTVGGGGGLVGCCLWGHTQLVTTEAIAAAAAAASILIHFLMAELLEIFPSFLFDFHLSN